MNNQTASSSGIGFFGALFLVFLILKLADKIQWSWWWVTSPLWIPISIVIFGLLILFCIIFLSEYKKSKRKK